MTREAVEKAIREAEAELRDILKRGEAWTAPATFAAWRLNILRSLVDAVLEEAAKAADRVYGGAITLPGLKIRALKSQPADKGKEPAKPAQEKCCERDWNGDGNCDRHPGRK